MTICFQVNTIEQAKRGVCQYDDKRFLLVDLPDGRINPNIHSYSHCDFAANEHLVADQLKSGVEFIIWYLEDR